MRLTHYKLRKAKPINGVHAGSVNTNLYVMVCTERPNVSPLNTSPKKLKRFIFAAASNRKIHLYVMEHIKNYDASTKIPICMYAIQKFYSPIQTFDRYLN